MTNTPSRRPGRPRAPEINAEILELLAFFGSDIVGCAAGLGVSRVTMNTRLKEDTELRSAYERGRAGFLASTAVNAESIIAMVRETRKSAAA
jgi:hypothetical protein